MKIRKNIVMIGALALLLIALIAPTFGRMSWVAAANGYYHNHDDGHGHNDGHGHDDGHGHNDGHGHDENQH